MSNNNTINSLNSQNSIHLLARMIKSNYRHTALGNFYIAKIFIRSFRSRYEWRLVRSGRYNVLSLDCRGKSRKKTGCGSCNVTREVTGDGKCSSEGVVKHFVWILCVQLGFDK